MQKLRIPKQCENCTKIFEPANSLVKKGYGKYCSAKCYGNWLSKNADRKRLSEIAKSRVGFVVSEETKKKISQKNRGRVRLDVRGENCNFWRGGINTNEMRERRSTEYINWRKGVFERDNYTCVLCFAHSEKGQKVYLEADHIKSWVDFPKLRFVISNGRTLCKSCHRKTPTWGRPRKKLLNFAK